MEDERFNFKNFLLKLLCSVAFDFIVGGIIFYLLITKVMGS